MPALEDLLARVLAEHDDAPDLAGVRRRVHRRRLIVTATVIVAAVVLAVPAALVITDDGDRSTSVASGGPTGDTAISGPERESRVNSIQPLDCGPADATGASCATGFSIGTAEYRISCGAIRPDAVTNEVLATGRLDGRETEVRRVVGVDPKILVALRLDAGGCDDGDEGILSPWTMALAGNAHNEATLRDAICDSVVDEHRQRNSCP